uniref:EF-hand domain-containing protein n=1 Tax=Sinocyclocheilus anshuiensis TaxID=1608454 RepID=A0A671LEV4_9TELE
MDLDSIGLNEVRPAVYQAALKLRALQKLCQMHLVALQDLCPVLNTLSSSGEPVISLAQEDVQQHLEELFQSISYKLPGEAVPEATDQTTRLLFKLFDREQTGVILLRSVEAALITLCGDTLSAKQRGLFNILLISISGCTIMVQCLESVLVSLQLYSNWLRATVGIRRVTGAPSVELHSKSCWKTSVR